MRRKPRSAGPAAAGLVLLLLCGARAWAEPPELEIVLSPASSALTGTLRVEHLQNNGALEFDLLPGLQLDSVTVAGKTATVTARGNRWRVPLPDAEPSGMLELRWSGRLPDQPQEAAGPRSDEPFLGEDGGYLPAGTGWMPRLAADWRGYRLNVVVDRRHRLAATGRLVEEAVDGDIYSALVLGEGVSEPPSLFSGPYRITEKLSGGIRIRTYFHAELDDLAEAYLGAAAEYLQRYSDDIGPYPFSDFHIISAVTPVGLGFPNLAYVSRRILPLPYMRGRSLAHEVLHNWWGNGVYTDYGSGNWAEGLTTYLADYALAEDQGPAAARDMRLSWLRDYAALPPERDYPLSHFRAKTHDASQVIGYNKAAFVFHMLRQEIGDAAFSRGLRGFWSRHRFEAASWADLETAFSAASGRDLDGFFRQWVGRKGAPEIHLRNVESTTLGQGVRIGFDLTGNSVPFDLNLPVTLMFDDRVEDRRLRADRPDQRFELDTSESPRALSVDPDYQVFRRLLPGEAAPILRDVTLAVNPALILLGDSDFQNSARALADRLLDSSALLTEPETLNETTGAALIVGPRASLSELLSITGASLPQALAGTEGSARVWTHSSEYGATLLLIEAEDSAALQSLLRPLPHYGRQSWLVFEAGRALTRGVWPSQGSPLTVRFQRSAAH